MLHAGSGLSVYDVAERLSVSSRTAWRLLQALEAAGEPLYQETIERRTVFRVQETARRATLSLSVGQMVSLALARRVFDFLDGTGLREDLDDVFDRLEATLRRRDVAATDNLAKKLWDVGEAPHRYKRRGDQVDALVTALLREDKLDVTYLSKSGKESRFVLRPYSMVVYKKGLYVVGERDDRVGTGDGPRLYALDAIRRMEWRKGDGFPYPVGYSPEAFFRGRFGLMLGDRAAVVVRFDAAVARYVERRRWHPSQRLTRLPGGGVELAMTVRGTTEVVSWVLSFGENAEVLAPEALRREVAEAARKLADRYATG